MTLPWSKQPPEGVNASDSGLKKGIRFGWFALSWMATLAVVVAMVGVIAFVSVPRLMGWEGVIVLSGSMEPALETGSIAFVDPAKPEDVKAGDILTFRREGTRRTLITHRVVDVQRTEKGLEFTTRGDANANNDGTTVKEAQVVGLVSRSLPKIGYAIDALRDRTNYYIFIGIPAALLILNEIMSIGAELRKSRKGSDADNAATNETAPAKGAWS